MATQNVIGTTSCAFCLEPIPHSDFEQGLVEQVRDGFAHQSCYDKKMGEGIDEQPIVSPTR